MQAQDLEKFVEFFNVPLSYFFGESELVSNINNGIVQNGNNNKVNINSLNKEIEGLKREMKLKDEIIELLKNQK